MIPAILAGGLFGAAVCFFAWTLIPGRADHTVVLARLDAARTRAPAVLAPAAAPPAHRRAALRRRAGGRVAQLLDRHGVGLTAVRRDLAMVDKSVEDHAGALLSVFAAALLALLILAGFALAAGAGPAAGAIVPLALLLAAAIATSRHAAMRRAASARRRQLRRAVEVYQDLVGGMLKGGSGMPEALPGAAAIGTAWPFRLLSQTLDRSRDLGTPAWTELSALGEHVGLDELRDLAPALALVGDEGALVADTLFQRASTMRRRDIADINGRAKERDTSMRVAIFLCGIGFLVLLMYPLITNFLTF